MTKSIFFDTGPLISLTMSRLLWILPVLKEEFGGKFYITPAVKRELVERPLSIKRFSFEALQALKLIRDGVLEVYEDIPQKKIATLISLANQSFFIDKKSIDVMQEGEMESIASALQQESSAIVTDERTLRLFVENPSEMKSLLERRFRKKIMTKHDNMNQFSRQLQGVQIIRSSELVSVAFKLGLLDDYAPLQKNGRKVLLDAILWTVKYNGCAVTEQEIDELENFLLKSKPYTP
ncbi:hypothetical protein HYT52_02405 [Candidatus Woesearchaeota archaeon]|nr:hypothetical protein [Candidatus Woesearchaeota archaeon]